MKAYIVWNTNKTEGYITFDIQVAYEVRKSAESNCFDENGNQMILGQAACEALLNENCTVDEIDLPENLKQIY